MTTKAGDEKLESTSGGGRLYNPYADLHGALDGRSVGNLYKLPDAPEFLFTEEAEVQRRSWSDNLTYWTGGGYLAGAIVGGGRGLAEGLREIEKTDTTKLRLNRILNASGLRGRQAGNMLGILGLLYAGSDSLITHYRGEDDMLNQIAAGLTTGTLYKAAAGPRTAVLAGAVGGATAALMAAAKQVTKRYGYSLL